MRIAIVSDIHGNRTAFEAVLADLRHTSPDFVLHGGDLADGGSSPVEIVDRIRELEWQGVLGNADEMLCRPQSLREFASQSPQLEALFTVIEERAAATRERLGQDRLMWLGSLPMLQQHERIALVHASPTTCWRAPSRTASDSELQTVYEPLGQAIAVYGHIHQSYIRPIYGMTVINTGSVSLSYDGDPRAAYLLLHDSQPEIRRVKYDVQKEVAVLTECGLPHSGWIARMLESAGFQMP